MTLILLSLFYTVALIALVGGTQWHDVGESDVTGRVGSEVTLKTGQLLRVRLRSNPTTGYSWAQDVKIDPPLLIQLGAPTYDAPTSGKMGAGGHEIFRFKSTKPGKASLQFSYRRPWEKDVSPDVIEWPVTVEGQ